MTGFPGLALSGLAQVECLAMLVLLLMVGSCFLIWTGRYCMPFDLDCMQTLRALNDLEFNQLASFERLVAVHIDRRVVGKEVFGLALLIDEAIPLGVVKPLDLTA